VSVRFEQSRSNGTRPSHPEVVKCGDRVHEKRSVAQDGKVNSWQVGAARRRALMREPCSGIRDFVRRLKPCGQVACPGSEEVVAAKANCGITLLRRVLLLLQVSPLVGHGCGEMWVPGEEEATS
jgi:hypothetical protein